MLDALLFALGVTAAFCFRAHILKWLFGLLGWGSDFHFSRIRDKFKTFAQVEEALRASGLESCELIVGVDFTKSNLWTGKRSNGGACLHAAHAGRPSPYERVLAAVASSLRSFDDDGCIPAYGFGDASTTDLDVFSFYHGDDPCLGLDDLVRRYRDLATEGAVNLSGPTSFAPMIRRAVDLVASSGRYHILLLVADGQVAHEDDTVAAIVEASNCALSIVVVGVGDGPFNQMQNFDDKLPQRRFDNFQFVEFARLERAAGGAANDAAFRAAFAMHCLQEVPEQFKAIARLGLLRRGVDGARRRRAPLQPPDGAASAHGPSPPRTPSAPPEDAPGGEELFPRDFVCPITQEVFQEPVFCSDGHSYERTAIESWLQNNGTSPLTNEPLSDKKLIRNFTLASQIASFREMPGS